MKIRITAGIAFIFIATLFIGFAIFKTGIFNKKDPYRYTSNRFTIADPLAPIDAEVPDSLPHAKYIRLKDSINYARAERDGTMGGSSLNSNFIGILDVEDGGKSLHFIKLQWWGLDTTKTSGAVQFFVKYGQSYLRKMLCDSVHYNAEQKMMQFSCMEYDMPVKFRYDTSDNAIMVPIGKNTRELVTILFYAVFSMLIAFYIIYVLIGFIKILISIAKGDPFSPKNVWRLKIIALANLIPPFAFFIVNLLFPLIFHDYFTDDWQLSNKAYHIFDGYILFGIIALALYFAFKNGLKLKEQQEFTI